jgi:hypothetical protein
MSTLVIQIGNSDDKLSQYAWSEFIVDIRRALFANCQRIHFAGGSNPAERWQNYCFVAEHYGDLAPLKDTLASIRKTYSQDSVALTIGETEFI